MKILKKVTSALLVSTLIAPIGAAQKRSGIPMMAGSTIPQELRQAVRRDTPVDLHNESMLQLVDLLTNEMTVKGVGQSEEKRVNQIADQLIAKATSYEDHIQAALAGLRGAEQEAAFRAHHLRVHGGGGVPGDRAPVEARSLDEDEEKETKEEQKDEEASANDSRFYEEALRTIHNIMTLTEQVRKIKLEYLADKALRKPISKERGEAHAKLIDKLREKTETLEGLLRNIKIEADNPNADDLNSPAMPFHCPHEYVVGKKITTLLPHFSVEAFERVALPVDMSLGTTQRIAQKRLGGILWDIFPHKSTAPAAPMWGPIPIPPPDPTDMTFLPPVNLQSTRCEYKFNVHHGWMKQSYSITLEPAEEQTLNPKGNKNVEGQLREEIVGENLLTSGHGPGKVSPRMAVEDERKQRLVRRDNYFTEHRIFHEGGYLTPSEIRRQTYGRVHVPDYRYGRTYERLYAIKKARRATDGEVEQAQHMMRWQEEAAASRAGVPHGVEETKDD